MNSSENFDTVITNGRFFDGSGGPSAIRNVGIRDGRIAAVTDQPIEGTDQIDAAGQWVLPGILDIHTHYEVEVLEGPGLPESLRHGVTTVMIGSCSLSTIQVDGVDAGDLFGRVEAIHAAAIEDRPLGPNEDPVDFYGGLRRMVNRNDATVGAVLVGGRTVVRHGVPTELVGTVRTGSFLRAGRVTPAPALTAVGA